MKISKIELKGYQQFKDVELDFTYPVGHKLVGKPLQKICIIGQSGTGKTSILRLIKYFVSRNRKIGPDFLHSIVGSKQFQIEMYYDNMFFKLYPGDDGGINVKEQQEDNKKITYDKFIDKMHIYEDKVKPRLINFPAELIKGNDYYPAQQSEEVKAKKIKDTLEILDTIESQKIVDFAVEEIEKIRNLVFKEIKEHKANKLLYKSKIWDIFLKENAKPSDIEGLNKEFDQWLKNNPDPLDQLAEKLNLLINKFGLKVKTETDLESILALGDIQLQTIEGVDVERPFWSTGTRHIVDTFVPLFELKPQEAVILMDEPEKSLFPDMQEMIVDFYTKLNPTCQFFFATHSPLIASSFDPWEVFHLEYDETNSYVNLVQNYTGDRHKDSYNYYPKYLRWDTILMNVFKLTEEGNSERDKMIMQLSKQFKELEKLKKEGKDKLASYKKKKEAFLIDAKKVAWDEKIS
jgi:predicted ATP-dependent endonuclease of OLD family